MRIAGRILMLIAAILIIAITIVTIALLLSATDTKAQAIAVQLKPGEMVTIVCSGEFMPFMPIGRIMAMVKCIDSSTATFLPIVVR